MLEDYQFVIALEHGLRHYFKSELMEGAEINIVEQNCGTPDESMEKVLSFLKRAADSLMESDYAYDRNLGKEIEEYIRNNTKEQTR